MGDSSVSCALSGFTLHGEPVWFLPLVKSRYAEKLQGARLIGYGSQACALFSPLTLPYKGVVDDYGQIEEIEKDKNTEIIEKWSGKSIEKFTEDCILGNDITVEGEQTPGVGCFFHPDIYDRFSKPVSGGKYADSLWASTFAGKIHLEAIGCQLVKTLKNERYCFVYKHPAIAGVSFHSDGEFSHVIVDDIEKHLHGHGLNDMQRALATSSFPLFPIEDVKRVQRISGIQATYKTLVQEILEDSRSRYGLENCKDSQLAVEVSLDFKSSDFRNLLDADKTLLAIYILEAFSGNVLLDRLEDLVYLFWSFTYANRILMPTICGTQYPEHVETSVMANYISKIAKKRIKDNLLNS